MADKVIKDDNLYLLDIGEGLKVKQISQTLSGYVVRSFNEQYADELFNSQIFSKNFECHRESDKNTFSGINLI